MSLPERAIKGHTLAVLKSFNCGPLKCHPGDGIAAEALGPNLQPFLRQNFVRWALEFEIPRLRIPMERPASTEPPRLPGRCVFVVDPDPVAAWKASVKATAETLGGSTVLARDLLQGTAEGSRMFRLASRVASERFARANGLNGRRPYVEI